MHVRDIAGSLLLPRGVHPAIGEGTEVRIRGRNRGRLRSPRGRIRQGRSMAFLSQKVPSTSNPVEEEQCFNKRVCECRLGDEERVKI